MSSDGERPTDLVIILGSPASGKTTLARRLSRDLGLACLCKDDVKEALFDVLGCPGRERSRVLSEASFTTLVRLARTQLEVGHSCIIEGNWRAMHAASLAELASAARARVAQVWCSADAGEIVRRFTSRRRHAGHLDALTPSDELTAAAVRAPAFLELPGPRLLYRSDAAESHTELLAALQNRRL